MVSALKPVDYARLGDNNDMFLPIEEIDPDIITIGFNQYFNIENLKKSLTERGIEADVVRVRAYEGEGFCSSRNIMEEILIRRCKSAD